MAVPVSASMPQGLDFGINYTIRIAALDPTTGDPVSGVVVSDTSIQVATAATAEQLTDDQPLWLPIPIGGDDE